MPLQGGGGACAEHPPVFVRVLDRVDDAVRVDDLVEVLHTRVQ